MKPMQFLFGLGNPGEKYELSRHNVGFITVAEIARQHVLTISPENMGKQPPFRLHPKQFCEIFKHEDLIFGKPQTFMNDSGKAVRATIEYFDKTVKFGPQGTLPQLWVIHDDLDLEVGRYKIQFGTGPKVHNGLYSIDEYVKTDQYWHVRIGVDGRQGDRSMPGQKYVLGTFSETEKEVVEKAIAEVSQEVLKRLADPA